MGSEACPIILAGSGRSGTTWVLDALAEANCLRPVFEPLNPINPAVPNVAYKSLDPETEWPELEKFLNTVLAGKYSSIWSDYRILSDRLWPSAAALTDRNGAIDFVHRWRRLISNYRKFSQAKRRNRVIVKFIRANLLLAWMSRFTNAKILLIVRHPGAVIESQLRLDRQFWDPQKRLMSYLDSSDFMNRYSSRIEQFDVEELNDVEAAALLWCIENQLAIEDSIRYGYRYTCYESLVVDGASEWEQVVAYLELPEVPGQALRKAGSQQASKEWKRDESEGKVDVGSWRNRLAETSTAEIQEILTTFGVSLYSMNDAVPMRIRQNPTL